MYLAFVSACMFIKLHRLCWIVSGHPEEETHNQGRNNVCAVMLRTSSATAAGKSPLAHIVQTAQAQLGITFRYFEVTKVLLQ